MCDVKDALRVFNITKNNLEYIKILNDDKNLYMNFIKCAIFNIKHIQELNNLVKSLVENRLKIQNHGASLLLETVQNNNLDLV